ncbi:MAG: DUF6062 family protein [Anaerolineales bacterium]
MRPQTYFDLLEACSQPGCPVCSVVHQSTNRYLENLFYENVNDVELRAKLVASRGFCNQHAWMALKPGVGDALGVAIIYHDVLGNVLNDLPSQPPAAHKDISTLLGHIPRQLSSAIKAAITALTPQAPCPACQQREGTTRLTTTTLIENLHEDKLSDALAGSDGLCLPHLRLVLDQVKTSQDFNILLNIHIPKLQSLRDELAELIRKNDYRYSDEEFGHERDAWRRAISQTVGSRPV